MPISSTDLNKAYLAYFGRPSDISGRATFANKELADVVSAFDSSAESKALYGDSIVNKINAIYFNLFNRDAEPAGLQHWLSKVMSGELTPAGVAIAILNGAQNDDAKAVANKLAAAEAFTKAIDTSAEILGYSGMAAVNSARTFLKTVDATEASLTAAVKGADAAVAGASTAGSAQASQGQTFTLTNGTDVATANIFNSGLVYNPAGTDRINALQSEDSLTGTGTNPTLNAVLGNKNDNGAASVTPTLNKIETINLQLTGDTNTLDVRFADSLNTLAITKITAEAADTVNINNIGQPAANLTVKDSAAVGNTVKFNYIDNVLPGTTADGKAETGNVTISNVNLKTLHIGNVANTQGFETLNLAVSKINQVSALEAIDLENLNISGSGTLSIVNTAQNTDRVQYKAAGITIDDGLGIRTIDLSGFNKAALATDTVAIDISAALGGHADPANSGQKYFSTTTGSNGNDTLWTTANLAADSATLKDVINAGTGTDTLKLIDASIKRVGEVVGKTDTTKAIGSVTGVENLEVRLQGGGAETVNLAAFDTALTSVVLRNEQSTGAAASVASTFTLREVGSTLGAAGISLQHASGAGAAGQGTPTAVVDTVEIRLADATGTKDTVALTVNTDLNTSSTYDYAIKLEAERDAAGAYKGFVENLTINDNDNETNTVTAISGNDSKGNITALGLTGTVTMTGGTAGKGYTVNTALSATTVDASTQLSNLTLRVGEPTDTNNYGTVVQAQTVKLGSGNDTLTFDGANYLSGIDTITDAAGTDTVRAWYNKDGGTPVLTGIEKFQLAATANSTIDLAKATGITELALLSDKAVDANNEIFTAGVAGVATGAVVTLKNTALSTINFFGDVDGTAADGGDTNTLNDSGADTQTFNGVTLANNTGDTVAVKISAPLINIGTGEGALPATGDGVKAYNLGQLTTHGVKTLTLDVSNEYSEDGKTVKASDATTTVANIYDKDLVSFTATAKGTLNLGTVSGNALGNNITTFNVANVGGNFQADVVALGDAATVTLAAGVNTFNALGSAGKNVTITSFAGNDTITGTAQDDTINSGAGNDTVNGDRGNNVLNLGAGDDVATAKDGNNTVAFGTGIYETATINDNTGLDASKATNVFTLEGTTALIDIDSNGIGASEVLQVLAVGAGSTLRVDWTGSTLNETGALLDGGKAVTTAAAIYTGTASADLVIAGAGEATTFNGGAGNDVLIKTDAVAVTFSGGEGNDTFIGNKTVTNQVTGGLGSDVIALASDGTKVADATAAKVIIADGDSTASGYDIVTGFNTAAAATNVLDLVFTTIQANTLGTDGTNVGTGTYAVKSHAINNGVVTFDNVDVFAGAEVVGTGATQLKLADVLSYLATNLNSTSATVGFAYDANGNGVTTDAVDSFFVFQDGAADTVVQLVGVQFANGAANVAAVAAAAAANTVVIA
jgi:hypothetical protein